MKNTEFQDNGSVIEVINNYVDVTWYYIHGIKEIMGNNLFNQ